MKPNQALIDDLLKLGENALSNLLGARHDARAHLREGVGQAARKFGLVSHEEFESALAMIAKARTMQEDLNERLRVIEAKLNLSGNTKIKKKTNSRLPSVKHKKPIKRRGR